MNIQPKLTCFTVYTKIMQHTQTPENNSALILAIINKQNAEALKLINNGANINAKNSNHETPLFIAAATGNFEVAQALLQRRDIKINVVSAAGWNALESAALRGDVDMVQLLMKHGAFIQNETIFDELRKRNFQHIVDAIYTNLNLRLRIFQIPEHDIKPNDQLIIKKLSIKNITRLQKIAANLHQQGIMNSETFSNFVAQVARKNPIAMPSKMTADKDNPEYFVIDDMRFRIDKNPLFKGGEGVVYGGYAEHTGEQPPHPDYCIKKFIGPNLAENAAKALHELKYLKSIGRRAAAVKVGNMITLVTEWQRGVSLESLRTKDNFIATSYADRIKWIGTGLVDLEKFHAAFRIHGDIKPLNLVLDKTNGEMKVIDMGTAQKINSPKKMVTTLHFIDMQEGYPKKMASDIYSMGKVIACMFPELYSYPMKKYSVGIANPGEAPRNEDIDILQCEKKKTTNLTPVESAIMQAVDAMMEATAEHRCTCEQAVKFFQLLHEKIAANELNEQTLMEIINTTINRQEFTVEDALRDSKRPLLFAPQARVVGEKVAEPPTVIADPTPVKKQKAKQPKPDAKERKPRSKHAESPSIIFNQSKQKKTRVARNASPTGKKINPNKA